MPKLRELNALNISARNWIRTFSDKRVFLMIPKSTRLRPSDRRIFRPAFPTRCPGEGARKRFAPPAAKISLIVMPDRSKFVFRFGRIGFPDPVGSEPSVTAKGAPLSKEKHELS